MLVLTALFFFVLGAIVGSFLNVVIFRFNTGTALSGRSRCFSCGNTVAWYDLIPILSFFFLMGRCRFCRSKISFQYPLVEFLTGLLFVGAFWRVAFVSFPLDIFSVFYALFTIDLVVLGLLVVIAVYDLKHKIIPDRLVFLFIILSLVKLFLTSEFSAMLRFPRILDLFAGLILALPIFLLWLISGGRWIGLGDAKLALGIGWFLGFSAGVSALVVGFWFGAAVSLLLLALSRFGRGGFGRRFPSGLKNLTMSSEVPLAPFLILGFLAAYFFRIDITGLGVLMM